MRPVSQMIADPSDSLFFNADFIAWDIHNRSLLRAAFRRRQVASEAFGYVPADELIAEAMGGI